MKRNLKKSMVGFLLTVSCMVGSIVPAFAADTQSADMQITTIKESEFTITVPKIMELSGDTPTTYDIKVTGDIASDEYVSVVPSNKTIVLSDASDALVKKADCSGQVTQETVKLNWQDVAAEAGAHQTGTITVNTLSGIWAGTVEFEASIQKIELPGIYKTSGEFISWNTLVNDYGLDVSKDYTTDSYNTDTSSPYVVFLRNNFTTGKIVLPSDITTIGEYAFRDCQANNIILPDGLITIKTRAFYNCSNLESITFPEGITTIKDSAFGRCTSISTVILPNSVTSLGARTFYDCNNITSIQLSNGLTEIDSYTFDSSKIQDILIPSSITTLSSGSFVYAPSVINFTGSEAQWDEIKIPLLDTSTVNYNCVQ